jgi:cell division septation protein DedD
MSQKLENVILFARAGFRGINSPEQVETVMNAVCESLEGQEILVDGKAVGTISDARVEGSLIRGDVDIESASFLSTSSGQNLCRRIGAHFEAKPTKSAAKPAAKKASKRAEPVEEPAEEPEEEEVPVKKTAPKKPAPKAPVKGPAGKGGKPIAPLSKGKIKVTL